ncbi:hypothetical protein GCM10008015_21190 [Flavobacterium palustre]|uniref:ABC transporter permease n=1 Tax=Flavobacterium palustre TaxID=1476463 RepID=A0ABQ1HKG2_9FLAO|nr:hypothetical protein [Flavobacterium palustre]GGA80239.1 hypothetical protein GCM10008015_21190 [Flavobacterium palustre]
MLLNNHFNIKRFSLLLKQDLFINRTKYLLTILGLGLVTYLLSYWFLSSSKSSIMNYAENINNHYVVCFVFYMMAVGVVVGTAFPDLTDKIKTANYLLSPASTFEKFLVQFLLRIGLFLPIALGIFWIAIRLAKASLIPEMINGSQFFDPAVVPYFEFRSLVTREDKLWDTWQILFFIFGFFSYSTYLFAGTTLFKRYALVKSVLISVILFFSCILFSMLLSKIIYSSPRFFDIQFYTFQVTQNFDSTEFSLLSLSLFSWIFFLGMAYFKLKEKEA